MIQCLEIDGKRCDDTQAQSSHVTACYSKLLNKFDIQLPSWDKNQIVSKLLDFQKENLIKWVTIEEIENVVKHMKDEKALSS